MERESKTYAGMDESHIHMTGNWLYDCIMQACEHDDDIDDACNGITDLIRVRYPSAEARGFSIMLGINKC